MKIEISIPSKTFLVGEYLALQGGPSLLVSTSPLFRLVAETFGEGRCEGIHPSSPAGQFVRDRANSFSGMNLRFEDPHSGKGGFGASGAEFLSVFILSLLTQPQGLQNLSNLSAESVWAQFRSYHPGDQGRAPSGADVMAQLVGGFAEFSNSPFRIHKRRWNFLDLDFLLVRTGRKIPTHQHLKNLQLGSLSDLRDILRDCDQALTESNGSAFMDGIRAYANRLDQRGWLAQESKSLVEELQPMLPEVLIKACGALGADVLLFVGSASKISLAKEVTRSKDLEVVADSSALSDGLQVRLLPQFGTVESAEASWSYKNFNGVEIV